MPRARRAACALALGALLAAAGCGSDEEEKGGSAGAAQHRDEKGGSAGAAQHREEKGRAPSAAVRTLATRFSEERLWSAARYGRTSLVESAR